jgi:glucose/mannose transport system substrate-binding protein
MYDVITRHFNGQLPTDQAVKELVTAVKSAS